VDKIYGEVAKLLELPDVKARFAAGGGVTGGMKPAEFAAQIRREATSAKKVVVAANVKAE
jgi:tripartite-type tricarboxylate transporter receptor subunit TctC